MNRSRSPRLQRIRPVAAILLLLANAGMSFALPQDASAPARSGPEVSQDATANGGVPGTPATAAPGDAPSNDLTAVVLEVEGKVRARESSEGEWKALKENDVLRSGAEVQTGLRSHAGIRMGRNATLLLEAGSTLIIPELRQDGQMLITRAAVKAGRADLKVDRVGLQNDFRIVTPSSTIAVAGTGLAVQAGRLVGTEITGAQLNRIAAIEAQWIVRRVAFFFGHGTSSSLFPNPAEGAINETVRRHILPGVVDNRAQLEQAWVNGNLQNVVFNLNNIQRLLNLDSSIFNEQLASVAALAQLLEIREVTGELANKGQGAAMLAAAFAQKSQQLAQQASLMLPQIEEIIEESTQKAHCAAVGACLARIEAEQFKSDAFHARDDAVAYLEETIEAIQEENYYKAQEKAILSGAAALLASEAASYATYAAKDAMGFAAVAAKSAASAQSAINDYFVKVGEMDQCAADASAQAAIAQNAAQASAALQSLANQLASAVQNNAAQGILDDINANVMAAAQAALDAAASRDSALAAASNARTMGERFLFNQAAVYASKAASDAATAQEAAMAAGAAAFEAKAAAALAYELAFGKGKGKGGGD